MTPELSRPVPVDRLPAAVTVEATEPERVALATRLRIAGIQALTCRFHLRRQGATIIAEGELHATVTQSCVVSLEPVTQVVHDRFELLFVPAGHETHDEDPESADELPYEGNQIDLGEATTEQLALTLDPYPRHPDATLDPAAIDDGPHPFAALTTLRREH